MTTTEFRIYVASLSDYNNGFLHGQWIDVTDADTIREEIAAMLADSPSAKLDGFPAEEWAIHDFEGFGPLRLSEYEDIEEIVALAEAAEEHGGAFLAWAAYESDNRDCRDFEDAFLGEWDSVADYVQDFWEQCGGLPDAPNGSWWHPANYIDWQAMGRDLEMSGDVWTVESTSGVWVFSNH